MQIGVTVMALTHAFQAYDAGGRPLLGWDSPCVLIDSFWAPAGSICPPQVSFNSFNYGRGSASYTLQSNSRGIAVTGIVFPTVSNVYGQVFFLVYEVY